MKQAELPAYLFGKAGLAALTNFIEPAALFAFDLDGTLAPIASDPQAIWIPDSVRKYFTRLAARSAVAVITGRSRSDALAHLGAAPRYLLGNHGVEGLPGWSSVENEFADTVNGWQDQLDVLLPLENRRGMTVENKGATLSIHYRQTQNRRTARAFIISALERLHPPPRRLEGKCVENLLPAGAPDKGAALALLMRREGFGKAFFIGDDETDENVFRLDREDIFTVRIGKTPGSRAKFHLRNQQEVARLLRMLNDLLDCSQKHPASSAMKGRQPFFNRHCKPL